MSSRANSRDHEARRTPGGRSLIFLSTGGLRSSATGFSHSLEIAHRISRPNPRSPCETREIPFERICSIIASAALDIGIATIDLRMIAVVVFSHSVVDKFCVCKLWNPALSTSRL